MTETAKRRRDSRNAKTLDGRERYTSSLLPDVRELLEAEAERLFGTTRRTNMVIERLAREHLKRSQ